MKPSAATGFVTGAEGAQAVRYYPRKDMQLTEARYRELREETGERIINGMCDTILSGPLG